MDSDIDLMEEPEINKSTVSTKTRIIIENNYEDENNSKNREIKESAPIKNDKQNFSEEYIYIPDNEGIEENNIEKSSVKKRSHERVIEKEKDDDNDEEDKNKNNPKKKKKYRKTNTNINVENSDKEVENKVENF
jgi:hypothetical protein